MKSVKHILTALFVLLSITVMAQKPSLGIVEIKSQHPSIDNKMTTSIIRFEVEKSQKYMLMDEDEMKYKFVMKEHVASDCFNQLCLIATGKVLEVDKMISGSVEKLGDNTLVTLKLYDVKGNTLETSKKIEVISDDDQKINEVISAAVTSFHKNPDNFATVDIRKSATPEPVVQKTVEPVVPEKTAEEELREYTKEKKKEKRFPKFVIMTRPSTLLEFYTKLHLGIQYSFDDLFAVKASTGYLFPSYRENVWTINGNEPGISGGFELRGELMLRFPKSYYDDEENYSRFYFSMEGMYQQKYHRSFTISEYDENLGAVLYYDSDPFGSRVMAGNFKFGGQFVLSNSIYFDPYMGIGLRMYRYNIDQAINNNGYWYYDNYTYNLRNRVLPNFVAGFDIGFVF